MEIRNENMRGGLVHDVTCIENVMTSEKIDVLKMWKRRWFIGVIADNKTRSITNKIRKSRTI